MKTAVYTLLLLLGSSLFTACKTVRSTSGTEAPAARTLNEEEQDKVERVFLDGLRSRLLGDPEGAIVLFNDVIDQDPLNHAAYFELSKLYAEFNNFNEAMLMAKKAVALDPPNKFYKEMQAQLHVFLGEYDQAADVFMLLTEMDPDDMESLVQLAYTRQQAGQLDEAISTYDRIEERYGAEPNVLMEKHRIYLQQGNIAGAAAELEKLIDLQPDDPQFYRMLSRLYEANGQPEKAAEVYDRILSLENVGDQMLIQVAEINKDKGDFAGYRAKINEAFESGDVSIDGKIAWIIPFVDSLGKPFDSRDWIFELISTVTEVHPDEAKAYSVSGDFLYHDGQLKLARDRYMQSLALEQNIYELWQQVFFIDSETRAFDSLAAVSERAIELFPNQPLAYYFNGFASLQLEDFETAKKRFKLAIPMSYGNKLLQADIYSSLGDAHYNSDEVSDAFKAYDKSLELNPENAFVLNNYSYYLSLRDDELEKASSMARSANELRPGNSSFEDTYAWVLYKQGKYEEAREWLDKAITNGGSESAVIMDHYGDVLFKLGDTQGAVDAWTKARDLGIESDVIDKKIAERKLY